MKKKISWVAILLFCFVSLEGLVNSILVTFFPIDNMLGMTLLGLCVLVIIENGLSLSKQIYMVLILIVLAFCYSFLLGINSYNVMYFIYFLSFGIAGIICATVEIDGVHCIEIGSRITAFAFFIFTVQGFSIIEEDYFSFGYMMLPGILYEVFEINKLVRERKFAKALIWIIVIAYMAYVMVKNSGRGIFVCIVVFVYLCILYLNRSKFLKRMVVIASIFGIGILLNLKTILYMVNSFLLKYDIQIYAIKKTLRLMEKGDITNGRMELYMKVFENIQLREILLGRGIGGYEYLNGIYTHNLFLSFFCDYGIVGMVLLCVALMLLFKQLGKIEIEKRKLYIIVISVSLIKLMLSNVYWKTSAFWFLLGTVLNFGYVYRNRKIAVVLPDRLT